MPGDDAPQVQRRAAFLKAAWERHRGGGDSGAAGAGGDDGDGGGGDSSPQCTTSQPQLAAIRDELAHLVAVEGRERLAVQQGGVALAVHLPNEGDPIALEHLVSHLKAAAGMFGTLVLVANIIWAYNLFKTAAGWAPRFQAAQRSA